ncbi:YSIRK-type signal peptide-containing protein [Streptococcus mitis]|uniref:YSIRK-type signal peptide-containing protein n=3 Tax=Streptococcus mitis TaxID=28037 RepID=A0A6L5H0X4_STRMT|nr:ZmpA/ZmpB/ZmpC family metallo-endopeptidase [Streptococcus mitis]MQP59355.1 YSIRK-type signal peptide-containing protein [Streptococcus mitis]MQP68725.1 YSIRK-type signal peptide-containing protein [Streptococcus mitis]MQP70601.1 YSIRK-type signal peptide-containing protein [Streptococcus mitis]MQP87207.1 YSIRK-type signal peptide-containing protein [Streptococcus mitis]MQP88088.1 YSIRK-type signal peptide-containing protein [Streptococcus mitis]
MRKTKQQLEKITKYSIRKLTVGVGPVAIGAFLFGASALSVDKVQANEVGSAHSVHYRYLAEQELTESEKALIHHEVPTEFQDDDILYVVYRKKATNSQQLPYTGSKELALAGLGLATASLAVFLVSKKGRKEVLGVLLIGSLGASTFVPYGTFAFENKELLSYNQTISATTHEGLAEGIIHIDGYEYIGYFKEAELHPSRPASAEKSQLPVEKQNANEIEKTEVVQERPAVTPETVVEKPLVQNPVAPAVEEKPVSEKSQTRQEENLVEIPFETVTNPDTNLAEGKTRIVTAGVKGQRRLVTKVSMVNGQEVREVIEDQVVQNPVSQVIAVGTKKEVQPAPTPVPQTEPSHQVAKGTQEAGKEGQALTQPELPEAMVESKGTQEAGKEGQALTQPELPEAIVESKGTQEAGKEGQALTQPELPEAIVESKGTQEAGKEGQALTQPELPEAPVDAKGTQEEGKEGQSLTQPELPEAVVESKGTQEAGKEGQALVQDQLPEYKVTEGTLVEESTTEIDYKTETTEDPTKYTDEETVLRNGEKGSQVTKTTYKTVEGVKTDQVLSTSTEVTKEPVNQQVSRGTKPIEGTLVEESIEKIPFEEKIEEDAQLKKGLEVVAQEGKEGQKKITKTFNTIKGVKTEDAPKVTEEVIEAPQDRILKRGTKTFEKPVLTITAVEPKDLKRTSDVKYSLENPSKAAIKSITLTLKKGDEIVKTLNVSPDNLTASLTDLQYYKDYKIETKMVYDRGEGDEEVVLNEEPLRIDLKKVEIKNIKETSLMSVDADGNETDTSLLTEKPADVAPLYLRVTTHDNKVTRLAVDKIEEVEKDGKTLYKVTAKAPDLVQRNADNTLSEEYVHYFEKQKAKEGNVYYNFNELVKDMKANPSGEFKLGADLNAANVPTPNKEYVPGTFKGKLSSVEGQRYSIHNMTRQLFGGIEGGSVKDVNLANVDINMPWIDNISALARTVKNATVENIKVTGSITGRDGIAGLVNKLDNGGQLTNVAYIGKLTGVGDRGWDFAGMVGEIWKGNVDKGYVEADIAANKARIGGFVARSDNGSDPNGIGKYGSVRNAVTKGTIKVNTPVEVGGFLSKNWAWGKVADSVSMMKVENGEVFYGSKDIDEDGGYFSNNALERNFIVKDVSTGKRSFKFSVSNRIKEVSQDEADQKIATLGITANDYVINPLVSDTLNNVKPKSDTYKDTQDYNADRELAYRNVEKLQPFYNKEWIVNQGNKLAADSPLMTKEVLSVTAMKGNDFVTDLTDADHIMVHYADKTKDIFTISPKESKVKQVKEYSVAELGEVVYTPNMVVKDRTDLISAIESKLSSVELQSDPIYQHLGRTGPNKVNAIKDLYLEESFKYVKDNLNKFVTKLVENEDHQLNTDEAAKRALIKKIDDNKAAVLLGLSYLNRYYGVKFDDFNIKELMLFKPDFYGKNVSVLDRIINIGSKESYIKGDRTHDAYREVIAGATGKGNLHEFLKYNMELFTSDTDLNDWFIKATKDNVYVVEPKTTTPEFADKKHRAYEGLNNDMHGKMILPLLNLKDAHMFLISTYNTMAYSSFEKYGKNTAEEREAFKAEINKVAKGQQNYLDFWSRLSLDKVRNQLLKSNNMVPTPVLDNQNYKGISTDKYGHTNSGKDVAPIRELYGPTGRYHATDWRMGAVARIYGNPYKDDSVFFMVTDMISDFGISAFTHETTHVNDRMVYLGGSRHREGTDLEAFAQGMLQSPAETSPNGDFKALGLNMAYERPNDGNQWYNTNPNDLTSRAEIDHYMKGFNDTLMLLDYLEGEAVLDKGSKELNNAWFKKVAKKLRNANTKNQYDEVRDLNAEEKEYNLTSVNDLVDKNFMTKHGPGNGTYDPTGFGSAYVTVPITAGIYGGNTSEGAPGSMSFKHNTFRMWGYFGYEKGFLNYASNMLKNESKQAGHATLGDDFIIKKVSDGKFNTLEDWKKEYFKEVVDKAKAGFNPVTIDGTTYSSYDDLKNAFATAVDKDKATLKNGSVKFDNTVSLKEKLFKKLLQQTNSFKTSIFK